ncbi:MAG: hypothetical protein SOS98_03820 [Varibaculum sp.]|nr:hypothetical protein [Varibaculum sp.]
MSNVHITYADGTVKTYDLRLAHTLRAESYFARRHMKPADYQAHTGAFAAYSAAKTAGDTDLSFEDWTLEVTALDVDEDTAAEPEPDTFRE